MLLSELEFFRRRLNHRGYENDLISQAFERAHKILDPHWKSPDVVSKHIHTRVGSSAGLTLHAGTNNHDCDHDHVGAAAHAASSRNISCAVLTAESSRLIVPFTKSWNLSFLRHALEILSDHVGWPIRLGFTIQDSNFRRMYSTNWRNPMVSYPSNRKREGPLLS